MISIKIPTCDVGGGSNSKGQTLTECWARKLMVGRDGPVGVFLGSEVKPQEHFSGSDSVLPTERYKEETIHRYALN